MAAKKLDGIVEAVHFAPDGQVEWVRAYLRRGPTFSDCVLVGRQKLVEKLEAGGAFSVGSRVPLMASTFEVAQPLRLLKHDGKAVIVVGDVQSADRDRLDSVPVI